MTPCNLYSSDPGGAKSDYHVVRACKDKGLIVDEGGQVGHL